MHLTNEQFDTVMREYEKKRMRADNERFRRHEEVLTRIPAMRDLDAEVASIASSSASLIRDGGSAPGEYRDRLADIRLRRRALLIEAGYPEDYLENVYDCPDCRDTGFIGDEKCHCFKQREINLLYEQSHLSNLARNIDFTMLREEYYEDDPDALAQFQCARDASRSFADRFPDTDKNLLFFGNVGTGKTTLTVCIAEELIRKGFTVLYFSAITLFELLADAQFSRKNNTAPEHLTEDLFRCDLLVIDDLGSELNNTFIEEQLFLLLNERAIRNKRMLISTNAGMEDLRRLYGDRVFSRILSGFSIYRLSGKDIRFLQATE